MCVCVCVCWGGGGIRLVVVRRAAGLRYARVPVGGWVKMWVLAVGQVQSVVNTTWCAYIHAHSSFGFVRE